MPFSRARRQPRRVVARAIALSGTALLAAALLAWTPQPTTGWDQSSAEATLWQLMNGARVNNGLQPVIEHGTVVSLARWRSQDMIDRNYFSHTILGTSWEIYHWYDSNGLSWVSGGENIGWNSGYADADSPVKMHEGLMASSGHRANILTPNWTHGGVGADAADGVNFLGEVRNPRVYAELFIQLNSAAPPAPTPKPAPKPTAQPTAPPAATAPLSEAPPSETPDNLTPVAGLGPNPWTASVRALASDEGWPPVTDVPVTTVANSLRVETADAADRGIFETVIGSLLGFFLG